MRSSPHITAGSLYVGVSVLLAAVAAWPIYRSEAFLVLVGVATLLAIGIAVLVTWRRWGGSSRMPVMPPIAMPTGTR